MKRLGKNALWDPGKRLEPPSYGPGKPCSRSMKCPCGEVFEMHGPEAVLMHVPHITATETIRRHVYERANRPLGHGPALGVREIRNDGAVQVTELEGTVTRTINRDFLHSFLRHFNSAGVAAARWQRERDARATRGPQGAIQPG